MAQKDVVINFKISKDSRDDIKKKVADLVDLVSRQNPVKLQFQINIPETTKDIKEKLDKVFQRIKPFDVSVNPIIPDANKQSISEKLGKDIQQITTMLSANNMPLITFGVNEIATTDNIKKSLDAILAQLNPRITVGVNTSNQNNQGSNPPPLPGNNTISLPVGLADLDNGSIRDFLLDAQKKIEDSTKNTTKIDITEKLFRDEKGNVIKAYDAIISEMDRQNGRVSKHYYSISPDKSGQYNATLTKSQSTFDVNKIAADFDPAPKIKDALAEITKLRTESTALNVDFSDIIQKANNITDPVSLAIYKDAFSALSYEVRGYRAELGSTLDPNQKFLKDIIEFPSKASTWEAKISELGTKTDVRDLKEKLAEAKALHAELAILDNGDSQTRVGWKKQFDATVNDIGLRLNQYNQELKTSGSVVKESNQLKNTLEQLEKYYIKYKVAIDQVPGMTAKFESLVARLQDGNYSNIATARADFYDFKQEARSAGVEIETFSQKVQRLFGNNLASAYAAFGVHAIMNNFMKLYQNVVKIDTALTELRKVSNATWPQMTAYLDKAIERSVTLGVAISDLINASAGFARLGYNLQQSAKLGEVATVLFNVGDQFQNVGEATESIVSAMHAFNIESERAMTIADKLNNVSNKFSISAAGIAAAMKKSAASLAVAGNSIDEAMGLIVGGNVVVQNPDTVGTMLKTTTLRLRAAKTELEEAGLESDGMAMSVSNLAEKIEQLTNISGDGGFSILTDSGNLKGTYEMLKGISESYQKMDPNSTNSAALLELISGKRNANAAASILTNFETVEKAMKASVQSQGSAMAEHERWLESIEAKTARLNAQMQELSLVLVNSNAAKGTIDMLFQLTKALTKLLSLSGSFPLFLTGLAGIASKKLNFGNSSENLPYPTFLSAVA